MDAVDVVSQLDILLVANQGMKEVTLKKGFLYSVEGESKYYIKYHFIQFAAWSQRVNKPTSGESVNYMIFPASEFEQAFPYNEHGRRGLSTWKYQFSYDPLNQATLSLDGRLLKCCLSVAANP